MANTAALLSGFDTILNNNESSNIYDVDFSYC